MSRIAIFFLVILTLGLSLLLSLLGWFLPISFASWLPIGFGENSSRVHGHLAAPYSTDKVCDKEDWT
jgi:hypothetical protein